MSAEIEHPLTRLDSAVSDTTYEPGHEKQIKHRRTSSTVSGVFRIEDLGKFAMVNSSCRLPCL